MATVNLNDLRVKNASNLLDSLNSPSNQAQAYMFIGRPVVWPTGDNNPPTPTNNLVDSNDIDIKILHKIRTELKSILDNVK